jgi:hypothetical protein
MEANALVDAAALVNSMLSLTEFVPEQRLFSLDSRNWHSSHNKKEGAGTRLFHDQGSVYA